MTDARFYDATSGLLTGEAFSFMVDHQLKHAQRAQEFITLVVFLAERRWRELVVEREWRELAVAADEWLMKEMARLIRFAVRNTDLLAWTADGTVSLLLVGIDSARASAVINRLNQHLRRYRATPMLHINVGAACCPTDAVQADDLRRAARRRAAGPEAVVQAAPAPAAAVPPADTESAPLARATASEAPEPRRVPYVARRNAAVDRMLRKNP